MRVWFFPRAAHWRRWHSRLALLLTATGLALFAAEIGLRIAGVDRPSRDTGMVPHPLWHHWHRADQSFDYHVPGENRVIPVHYNAQGMRQSLTVTPVKPPGILRVAVLGDSFVEALQVHEHEGVCRRLEEHLRERLHREVEVLNFGCSGFSTSLELVLLRECVLHFQPDVVVLCHHFSDVTEDWRFATRTQWEQGELKVVRHRGTGWTRRLRRRLEVSQLYRVASGVGRETRRRPNLAHPSLKDDFDAIVNDPYTAADDQAWDHALGSLKRMADRLRQDHVPFLVALIPIGPQVEPVDPAFARELGYRYLAGGERLEHRGYQRKMTEFCGAHDVPCVDLLPSFLAANPTGKPVLFLPRDQHWTAAGHDLAAWVIAQAVPVPPQLESPPLVIDQK